MLNHLQSLSKQRAFGQQFIAILLLSLALSSCGFRLRGAHQIPPSLRVMDLDLKDSHSELGQILRQQLLNNEIELVNITNSAKGKSQIARLTLLQDKLDRRALSLFPNGQVAEHELIYTVRYEIALANQRTQQFEFEINRDYQDDPKSALAKSKELQLILKEMRSQASDTIIRRLASFDSAGQHE